MMEGRRLEEGSKEDIRRMQEGCKKDVGGWWKDVKDCDWAMAMLIAIWFTK